MHHRVLILTAVQPEARALARAFSLRPVRAGNQQVLAWQGDTVILAVAGVRAKKLDSLSPALGTFKGVIMAGLAGALSPALAVGDVVVDAPLGGLPGVGGAVLGLLHTSGSIVSTAREKADLFAETGCLAVDMETQIARAFAAKHSAAFVAVRGISDSAREPLDPALLTLVDDEGRARVGRAIGMVCRRPGKLPAMLRLGRSSTQAMRSVAGVVGKIVASGWPAIPEAVRKDDGMSAG